MAADSLHSEDQSHLSGPTETVTAQGGHRTDFQGSTSEITSQNQPLSQSKPPAEENPRILIITDDDRLAGALAPIFHTAGLLAERASSMTEGSEIAESGGFQVVVTTPHLKDGSWNQLVGIARHQHSSFGVILLANPCDRLQRSQAIEEGALEVLDAFSDLPRIPEAAKRAFWIEYLTGACPKTENPGFPGEKQ